MSHMNILKMSEEIKNINKRIDTINDNINNISTVVNKNNNIITDLDQIKMNKLECISELEEIKNEFQTMNNKVYEVNDTVISLLNRDINYIETNTKGLNSFLKKHHFHKDKINILIYLCKCNGVQDILLLKNEELATFGFSNSEITKLYKISKDHLEELV